MEIALFPVSLRRSPTFPFFHHTPVAAPLQAQIRLAFWGHGRIEEQESLLHGRTPRNTTQPLIVLQRSMMYDRLSMKFGTLLPV